MKVLLYSAKNFEIPYIKAANKTQLNIEFTKDRLSIDTVMKSKGYDCVSIFTADNASRPVIEQLHLNGVKYIATRAAGYDNIDIAAAAAFSLHVANVPDYSPYSVAEHTIALLLALNRKLMVAQRQVQAYNFTLDKLIGFDLHHKTAGVIGTGKIGGIVAKILHGFGCHVWAHDINESEELRKNYNVNYCQLDELCKKCDIITIHVPLNDSTKYMLNRKQFSIMKKGVMLINTDRGAVVNTRDLIEFLENGTISAYGMDVYEKESGVFFVDHSQQGVNDPLLEKLMHRENVLITPHQGFATHEALTNIADTTFYNILEWQAGLIPENELTAQPHLISAGDNKK